MAKCERLQARDAEIADVDAAGGGGAEIEPRRSEGAWDAAAAQHSVTPGAAHAHGSPRRKPAHVQMQETRALAHDSAQVGGGGGQQRDTITAGEAEALLFNQGLDDSGQGMRPKRNRRPAKRLEPGKNEPPPYAEWLATQKGKTKDDRAIRAAPQAAQAQAPPAPKDPPQVREVAKEAETATPAAREKEREPAEAAASSTRRSARIESRQEAEEEAAAETSSEDESVEIPYEDRDVTSGDGTVWPAYDELLLLQAALSDPDKMISHGAGEWMVENGNHKAIIYHWDEMIRRGLGCGKPLAETPARDAAHHVFSACLATCSSDGGGSTAAMSMALHAAGWRCVPAEMVALQRRQALAKFGDKNKLLGVCKWHRPSQVERVPMKPNLKKTELEVYVKAGMMFKDAWIAHMDEMHASIENALDKAGELLQTRRKTIFAEEDDAMAKAVEELQSRREHLTEENMTQKLKTMLRARKQWVVMGDPRPSRHCGWCGPTFHLEHMVHNREWVEEPGCDACRLLQSKGWRMVHKWSRAKEPEGRDRDDIKFTDPNGTAIKSVKQFLNATSEIVAGDLAAPAAKTSGKRGRRGRAADVESERAVELPDDDGISSDAVEQAPPPPKIDEPISTVVPIPTIAQLLNEERGLAGALNGDRLGIWNTCYGSDSDIALLVLQSLSTGKLPHLVRLETPFFRPEEELHAFPGATEPKAPPTRFIGVTRMIERRRIPATPDGGKEQIVERSTGAFGVEFPIFIVKYDDAGFPEPVDGSNEMDPPMPKPATAGGRKVLLRADIAREDVAGQLFAFMFRVMYGEMALNEALALTNGGRSSFFHDTTSALGATALEL